MFGYGDLVVDPRNLVWMRDAHCPVVSEGLWLLRPIHCYLLWLVLTVRDSSGCWYNTLSATAISSQCWSRRRCKWWSARNDSLRGQSLCRCWIGWDLHGSSRWPKCLSCWRADSVAAPKFRAVTQWAYRNFEGFEGRHFHLALHVPFGTWVHLLLCIREKTHLKLTCALCETRDRFAHRNGTLPLRLWPSSVVTAACVRYHPLAVLLSILSFSSVVLFPWLQWLDWRIRV